VEEMGDLNGTVAQRHGSAMPHCNACFVEEPLLWEPAMEGCEAPDGRRHRNIGPPGREGCRVPKRAKSGLLPAKCGNVGTLEGRNGMGADGGTDGSRHWNRWEPTLEAMGADG
jgi:hypothetical protein